MYKYIVVYDYKLKKNIRVLEHRYLMEKKIRRKLLPFEIVHHKDGDKQNNNIDNLCILHYSDHRIEHSKGKILSRMKIKCTMCEKPSVIKGLCRYHYGKKNIKKVLDT